MIIGTFNLSSNVSHRSSFSRSFCNCLYNALHLVYAITGSKHPRNDTTAKSIGIASNANARIAVTTASKLCVFFYLSHDFTYNISRQKTNCQRGNQNDLNAFFVVFFPSFSLSLLIFPHPPVYSKNIFHSHAACFCKLQR